MHILKLLWILFYFRLSSYTWFTQGAQLTVRPVEVGDNCHQLNIRPIRAKIRVFPANQQSASDLRIPKSSRLFRGPGYLTRHKGRSSSLRPDNPIGQFPPFLGSDWRMRAHNDGPNIVPTVTPALLVPWEAGSQDILL